MLAGTPAERFEMKVIILLVIAALVGCGGIHQSSTPPVSVPLQTSALVFSPAPDSSAAIVPGGSVFSYNNAPPTLNAKIVIKNTGNGTVTNTHLKSTSFYYAGQNITPDTGAYWLPVLAPGATYTFTATIPAGSNVGQNAVQLTVTGDDPAGNQVSASVVLAFYMQ